MGGSTTSSSHGSPRCSPAVPSVAEDRSPLQPFEEAPAAIAIQRGAELRWELANRRFRALLGGRDLVGERLADILPEWSALRRILEEVVRSGQPFSAREYRFLVDPEGKGNLREAWFDLLCEPLRDASGQVDGVFSFAVDVTVQVEVRDRLERAVADAQRAIAARDEFLSIASHELKTPVTALRLQVQALERTLERGPDVQVTREALGGRVGAIDRQIDRLVELIEALLDVTRFGHGPPVVIPASVADEIDLAALTREIVERQRPAATAAGSALTFEAPAPLRGYWDRSRVDQVVTNLLANAIKYGRGKPIRVAVGPAVGGATDGGARIDIVDEGLGIAPEDHARIFERFERAVPRQHYSGLGLGLWISRRIAETLGGRITVESELGRGARFTLWLP
jgi:signal transduction histidine kinase